jgi:zinc transporter, ZIP family
MDGDVWSFVGLALLPVGGMLLGSLAAEWWRLSHLAIGALLHAAAGVAVAVVSVELMPRVLDDIAPWQLAAAFLLGAAASVAMAAGAERAVRALELGEAGPWKVYLAVAVDLMGDGLMVGIGSAVAGGLGFMLGLSQVIANIPGGFVALANLRDKGVARKFRLAATASLCVPVLIGAGFGFWLLRGQSINLQNAALTFVAGMLLLATIEDLVPQADKPKTRRVFTTTAFAAGFIFFTLGSIYLGSR